MGFLNKVFGGGKKPDVQLTAEMAGKIINTFGEVLEKEAATAGSVKDVSRLPYPKKQIKLALIMGLMSVADPQMKEHLKTAYISLADWQEEVGEKTLGMNTMNMDPNQDVKELAKQVSQQMVGYDKWIPVVQTDLDRLQKELKDLGLW